MTRTYRVVRVQNKGMNVTIVAQCQTLEDAQSTLRSLLNSYGGKLNVGGMRGSYKNEAGEKLMLQVYTILKKE